jgi:hypothetical protein
LLRVRHISRLGLRTIIRWAVLLLALLRVAFIAPEMWNNFWMWRAAVPGNPAAAEFWAPAFYLDAREVAIVLSVAIILWFVLRKKVPAH